VFPLRDDTPCERRPVVTWALLAANLLAFGWQLTAGDRSLLVGGAIPYELLTLQDTWPRDLVPPPLTVFTSMFLHAGLWHLGGNMLFLWIFANNVEDALGRGRFLAFYLGAGVLAAAAQTLATAVQAAPLEAGDATALLSVPMVGASGAIAGVLGAYLVLFPRARVQTLLTWPLSILAAILARRRGEPSVLLLAPVRIAVLPAWFFLGLWFLLQVGGVVLGGTAGVAVFAHLGGFVAGLVLVRWLGRRAA
jgi:membrane associated rhomboid family serine protease